MQLEGESHQDQFLKKAIDLNRKMLDANFASDLMMQVKSWKDTAGINITNDVTLYKNRKSYFNK